MPEADAALEGYRVLDLSDEMGAYCTKLLADLGADVVKIEGLKGDPTRSLPPFKDDIPHPERSLYFAYLNTNKKSITLNLRSVDGQAIFKELVKRADVVVESFPPGVMQSLGLDYPALKEINPGIIMASITGFGQSGPYKDFKAPDIVGFAMGGVMYFGGPKEGPPLASPIPLAYFATVMAAPQGILIALYHRLLTGKGQHVDISVQECVVSGSDWSLPAYSYEKKVKPRPGRAAFVYPGGVFPCKDGHVYIIIIPPQHWRVLLEWMGNPPELTDPVWNQLDFRVANADVIEPFIEEFTKKYTKAELCEEAQRRHLPFTPVNTPAEFLENEHIKAREYFVQVEHPEIGRWPYAGAPYKFSETPWRIRSAAPLLGQHNEEFYVKELGFSQAEIVALRQAGVI